MGWVASKPRDLGSDRGYRVPLWEREMRFGGAGAGLEAPPHFEIDAAFEDGLGGFGGGGGAE